MTIFKIMNKLGIYLRKFFMIYKIAFKMFHVKHYGIEHFMYLTLNASSYHEQIAHLYQKNSKNEHFGQCMWLGAISYFVRF